MKYHIVRQGDCLASISEEYGFLLSTIWNHPENAKLRSCRKDPNVLFPGDKVFIPDADVRVEESTTDERHTFQLLNEATVLHTRFIRNNRPSAGERFLLVVDSCEVRAGVLDDDGALMVPILGGSKKATVTLGNPKWGEVYELFLGHLDPIEEIAGVHGRLSNLGYLTSGVAESESCDTTAESIKFQEAVKAFQIDQRLPTYNGLDEVTRQRLKDVHGS